MLCTFHHFHFILIFVFKAIRRIYFIFISYKYTHTITKCLSLLTGNILIWKKLDTFNVVSNYWLLSAANAHKKKIENICF